MHVVMSLCVYNIMIGFHLYYGPFKLFYDNVGVDLFIYKEYDMFNAIIIANYE